MAPTATDARSASLPSAAASWTRARSRPRSRRWAPRTRSPGRSRTSASRLALRRLIPEDQLGDHRHGPPDRPDALASSTSTPSCSSRRRTRPGTRSPSATGSSSSASSRTTRPGSRALGGGRVGRGGRLLRDAQGRDDAEGARRDRLLGLGRPPGRLGDARRGPRSSAGISVSTLEAQPARRLGRQAGLELHQGPPRPVQPAPRPGLPVDRVHALHHEAGGRRGPARGPLGRHRPDRVRHQWVSADLDPLTSRAADGR